MFLNISDAGFISSTVCPRNFNESMDWEVKGEGPQRRREMVWFLRFFSRVSWGV